MKFSLFFFSDDETQLDPHSKYKLLVESAKFADKHGLDAIWVPERHFDAIGGLYPNPSVLAAALAMITKRIRIRSGSIILPLHNILRVAEEWSVVDNLSQGRVDLGVASGWHPHDFVLSSWDNYERKNDLLFESLSALKTLWSGNSITINQTQTRSSTVRAHPAPIQKEIDYWVSTSSKYPTTWIKTGEVGANILTALLIQTVDDLRSNIEQYKQSLRIHGFDPQTKDVTLMLHSFVGKDDAVVKQQVKKPLVQYIKNHLNLYETSLSSEDVLTEDDKEALAEHSFDKYYESSGLLGSIAKCANRVEQMKALGVTEIACLIDFGVNHDLVIQGLEHLCALKDYLANKPCNQD